MLGIVCTPFCRQFSGIMSITATQHTECCTGGYTVKCMSAHADSCVFDVSVVLDRPNNAVTDSHRALRGVNVYSRHCINTADPAAVQSPASCLGLDKGNVTCKEEGEKIEFSQCVNKLLFYYLFDRVLGWLLPIW